MNTHHPIPCEVCAAPSGPGEGARVDCLQPRQLCRGCGDKALHLWEPLPAGRAEALSDELEDLGAIREGEEPALPRLSLSGERWDEVLSVVRRLLRLERDYRPEAAYVAAGQLAARWGLPLLAILGEIAHLDADPTHPVHKKRRAEEEAKIIDRGDDVFALGFDAPKLTPTQKQRRRAAKEG